MVSMTIFGCGPSVDVKPYPSEPTQTIDIDPFDAGTAPDAEIPSIPINTSECHIFTQEEVCDDLTQPNAIQLQTEEAIRAACWLSYGNENNTSQPSIIEVGDQSDSCRWLTCDGVTKPELGFQFNSEQRYFIDRSQLPSYSDCVITAANQGEINTSQQLYQSCLNSGVDANICEKMAPQN